MAAAFATRMQPCETAWPRSSGRFVPWIPTTSLGQSVARAMNLPVLPASKLTDLEPFHLQDRTPLWFYVLREAQAKAAGKHLGPVGGRIVGEVIYGLIMGDSQSYLTQDPTWTPTYGRGDVFEMTDLLTKAGVVGGL